MFEDAYAAPKTRDAVMQLPTEARTWRGKTAVLLAPAGFFGTWGFVLAGMAFEEAVGTSEPLTVALGLTLIGIQVVHPVGLWFAIRERAIVGRWSRGAAWGLWLNLLVLLAEVAIVAASISFAD
jgi:hypothetical protein